MTGTIMEGEATAARGGRNGNKRRLCKVVSTLLHPFAIPSYIIGIILFGNSLMAVVPTFLRLYFWGIAIIDTLFLPAALILAMSRLGIISGFSMEPRRNRLLSILATGLCYLLTMLIVRNIPMAFMVYHFFTAALICAAATLVIAWFWNISLHMVAAGGAVATLFLFTYSGVGPMLWITSAAILLSGILGSSRLRLGSNNLAQTGAGFAWGFAVMFLILRYAI